MASNSNPVEQTEEIPSNIVGQTDGKLDCIHPLGQAETDTRSVMYRRYATQKTLGQGLLDIGLLMANASQLRKVCDLGPTKQPYYWFNLILISLSLFLQVIVGIMCIILGNTAVTVEDKKHKGHLLNNLTLAFVLAITVVNVIIGAFGQLKE